MRKLMAYFFLLGVIGIIYSLYKAIVSGSIWVTLGTIGGSITLILAGVGIYTLIEIRDELKAINKKMEK